MITLGSVVHRELEVVSASGALVDPATLTLTVQTPSASAVDLSASVTVVDTGIRGIDYVPAATGRYVFKWRTTVPTTALDQVFVVTGPGAEPRITLAEVKTYLGSTSWTDPEIQDALDAELAAQDVVCRQSTVYPPDLKQALKRRVARNLALRALPVGIQASDTGATYVAGRDPEIRRLEAPYRRLVVG